MRTRSSMTTPMTTRDDGDDGDRGDGGDRGKGATDEDDGWRDFSDVVKGSDVVGSRNRKGKPTKGKGKGNAQQGKRCHQQGQGTGKGLGLLQSPTGPALVEVEERAERVARGTRVPVPRGTRVARVARAIGAEVERAEVDQVEPGSTVSPWRGNVTPTAGAMSMGATWIGLDSSSRILMLFSLFFAFGCWVKVACSVHVMSLWVVFVLLLFRFRFVFVFVRSKPSNSLCPSEIRLWADEEPDTGRLAAPGAEAG